MTAVWGIAYGRALECENHRARFLCKWRLRCKAVVSSLEEAGEELFTFLQFPQSHWKALRTVKRARAHQWGISPAHQTQASLPVRMRFCCCCMAFCAAARSHCTASMAARYDEA